MAGFRVVAPKNIVLADPNLIVRAVESALDMTAENILIDFQVTTRTWVNRPVFLIYGQPGYRTIYTTDLIYKFIARGTRVRYAIMSRDFRAKTQVGQILSRVGKGGMVFISKLHPRPGIQAREYETVIGDKWKRTLPQALQTAIDVEVKAQQARSK